MPQQVALATRARVGGGKGEARSLRRQGRVPAIAYGSALEATPLSVDARELYHALHTDAGLNAIISLQLDGQTHLALARHIQRHPVRREVLHVDFVTVDRHRKVVVDIPLHLEGEAPGSDEGGVVDQTMHVLQVEVLPLEVPSEFTLDISELQIGDVRRVEDVTVPEGVTVLDDSENTVVTVYVPQMEVPEDIETEVTDEEAELVGPTGEELGDQAAAEAAAEGEEPSEGDERE